MISGRGGSVSLSEPGKSLAMCTVQEAGRKPLATGGDGALPWLIPKEGGKIEKVNLWYQLNHQTSLLPVVLGSARTLYKCLERAREEWTFPMPENEIRQKSSPTQHIQSIDPCVPTGLGYLEM
jgi:hypothetical protein